MPDALSAEEAAEALAGLLAEVPWERHELRIFGRVVEMPRRIAWFGPLPYRYSGVEHPARPMPPRVAALRDRVEALTGRAFDAALVNLYRDGRDSMGWHADDDYDPRGQPTIASLSLGATRRFRVRGEGGSWSVDLPSGSLLVMGDDAQARYQHALPKMAGVEEARINLTFRHTGGRP